MQTRSHSTLTRPADIRALCCTVAMDTWPEKMATFITLMSCRREIVEDLFQKARYAPEMGCDTYLGSWGCQWMHERDNRGRTWGGILSLAMWWSDGRFQVGRDYFVVSA